MKCLRGAAVADAAIQRVRELILCTKSHVPGTAADAPLLIDLDLAILGQPANRFWDYEHGIRAECAWVLTANFAEKRAEILTRFLARPVMYHTKSFRLRYEARARANLQLAIAQLRSPA